MSDRRMILVFFGHSATASPPLNFGRKGQTKEALYGSVAFRATQCKALAHAISY
jgi:hypothetical protein